MEYHMQESCVGAVLSAPTADELVLCAFLTK